ncbi:MAG: hypothetical protein HRU43_05120, partial [Simkaniaceae bacterium]|nr:hypothetical protein [Simkaniaceae bacterium]
MNLNSCASIKILNPRKHYYKLLDEEKIGIVASGIYSFLYHKAVPLFRNRLAHPPNLVSAPRLAKQFELDLGLIRQGLRQLKRHGLLFIERAGQHVYQYYFNKGDQVLSKGADGKWRTPDEENKRLEKQAPKQKQAPKNEQAPKQKQAPTKEEKEIQSKLLKQMWRELNEKDVEINTESSGNRAAIPSYDNSRS